MREPVVACGEAVELGANTFQIFSTSPRSWNAGMPRPNDIRRFNALREKHDLTPLVVHANYLVNLAAAEGLIRTQSIAAFTSGESFLRPA